MNLRNLTAKDRKKIHIWLRAGIQLLYFIFLPSAYTAAFAGVKYLFTQIGTGDQIELTSFVKILLVLCVFTIVFGRFFCGFACAFGSLGDGVHGLYRFVCRKIKKKPVKIPDTWGDQCAYLKYFILLSIVLLCFWGIYGKTRGTSPWDVFSMIHGGNFKLSGYVPGIIFLCLILAGMCLQERFFCRNLCPMGAIFSLLPVLPTFALFRKREACIKGCSGCTRNCPSNLGLASEGSWKVEGDCFQCLRCVDTCPKSNIHTGIGRIRGNEIWFTLLRAAVLLGLFLWLGV